MEYTELHVSIWSTKKGEDKYFTTKWHVSQIQAFVR